MQTMVTKDDKHNQIFPEGYKMNPMAITVGDAIFLEVIQGVKLVDCPEIVLGLATQCRCKHLFDTFVGYNV